MMSNDFLKRVAFCYLLMLTTLSAYAQRTELSGTVTSELNEPLTGVSIRIKGTNIAVQTDARGYFIIPVDGPTTLIFSHIGYSDKELDVGGEHIVSVVLEQNTQGLNEVIVVGYGVQSKRNITGSVSKVAVDKVEGTPTMNIAQTLRGKVAGVQFTSGSRPGQNGTVLIRGRRSLTGGNNPLIILDGIFFNGGLTDINVNDIASMEILKDASSTAIYGSRAANGVILITSKRGTTNKPQVRVNSLYGTSNASHVMKLLDSRRYIQKTLDVRRELGLPSNPEDIRQYLTSSEAENYDSGRIIDDPWKVISQQAALGTLDVNVSGQGNNVNYLLSGSLADEQGLIYNDQMRRYTFRTNLESNLTNWLSLGMNSTFIQRNTSDRPANPTDALWMSPFGSLEYEDQEPTLYVIREDVAKNPLYDARLTEYEAIWNNLFTNFYAKINAPFLDGLSYRINFSPSVRWGHNYSYLRQDRHREINNTSASKFNQQDYDWVLENILTYKAQIGSDHDLDATLLYGRNHFGFESTTANASQFPADAVKWNRLDMAILQTNSSDATASDGSSLMARLNYGFKNRYLFTFTVRRDGSSVFAANNKYAAFPSAAFAWVISDESFVTNSNIIGFLKLRVSHGVSGNQAIAAYQSLSFSGLTRYVFGDGGTTSIGLYSANMANPNLKWETTSSTNAGLDFELFHGRLGGTIEAYHMDTDDLLVRRSLPITSGYTSVITNIGATNNKGIELSFNTVNIRSNQFEWSTNVVFSRNINKIVHLYRSDINGDGREDDDLGNRWFIGKPINVGYDYIWDGIYQDGDEIPAGKKPGDVRLKDLNGNGIVNADDRSIIGPTTEPNFRWGVTNEFRLGGFSLSIFLNAMQGWVANIDELNMRNFTLPSRPFNMFDMDWWTPENRSNTNSSLTYVNSLGHGKYFSRNFVRIQDVTLSYAIPPTLLHKLKLSSGKVYIGGRNLHTFTKFPGLDPEIGYNVNSLYPMPRTLSFGLNFSI